APPAAPAWGGPAARALLVLAALCVAAAATFRTYEPDLWQHLLVGKVMWQSGRVPLENLWTWPSYGAPDLNSSWAFEALLWPFWAAGGGAGLAVWRWAATLSAFALLWLAARRMGVRGAAAAVVLVWFALIYRERAQARPESLAAVLLAAELWILETRRAGGPDRARWLVPIQVAWVNVHLSFALGLVVIGVYALARAPQAKGHGGRRPAAPRPLWPVLIAAALGSLLNPFTWRAAIQPFEFLVRWRGDPLMAAIVELHGFNWAVNLRNGFPLALALWPALQAWRALRGRFDGVEAALFALATVATLASGRFIGFWAVIGFPFVARGVDEWTRARRVPAFLVPRGARAAAAGGACLALCAIELTNPALPFGIGLTRDQYPERACDFIAAHGIRGRAFNHFDLGGYMLWRFWPDRGRLPFIDTHPERATELDRSLYLAALTQPGGWAQLVSRRRPEFALLERRHARGDVGFDAVEADSSWALVFADDAAAVYVDRHGPLGDVAARLGYRWVALGRIRLSALGARCLADSALRPEVRAELERMAAASPFSSSAHSLLANLAMMDRRFDEARRQLEEGRREDPLMPRYHERLGLIALREHQPAQAIGHLERERREQDRSDLEIEIGGAYALLGRGDRARACYRRALALDPANDAARDSLTVGGR
ncbi:MAG TPA: hypothetical protein VI792_07080, partial [Candidatus Eisenbacteria bacterium]